MPPPSEPTRVFIVGAQRCGTTFLYHLLDAHPDIAMARPVWPEPKIFLTDDVTGEPAAYDARLFPDRPRVRVRGEKATSYLEHPVALARIARTFPDAHVVVAVRDPIERALSNFRFSVDNGWEDRPADVALLADLEGRERSYDSAQVSASPYAYVRRGLYLEHLRRVEEHVDAGRVHVMVFEELVADPGAVGGLYATLGVDATDVADRPVMSTAGAVANPSVAPATLPSAIREQLRAYYADANAALARHLDRSLPWP